MLRFRTVLCCTAAMALGSVVCLGVASLDSHLIGFPNTGAVVGARLPCGSADVR
jgi:hypothetical protein